MNEALTQLCDSDLQTLIAALRSGRVAPPYSELQVSRVAPRALSSSVRVALVDLESNGFSAEQIATVLSLIALDRARGRPSELPIDFVTSGPEAPGITNRDTSVVVRELFAHAKASVLVVGYAVYQGQKVFEALARRMETMCCSIAGRFVQRHPRCGQAQILGLGLVNVLTGQPSQEHSLPIFSRHEAVSDQDTSDRLIHIRMRELEVLESSLPEAVEVVLPLFALAQHIEKVVRVFLETCDPTSLLVGILVFPDILFELRDENARKNVSQQVIQLAPYARFRGERPGKTADNICPDVLRNRFFIVRFPDEQDVVRLGEVPSHPHQQMGLARPSFAQNQDALTVRARLPRGGSSQFLQRPDDA